MNARRVVSEVGGTGQMSVPSNRDATRPAAHPPAPPADGMR
jgi:hypothetical protein